MTEAAATDSTPDGGARPGNRSPLRFLLPQAAPLDLRILGRTLLHAALVGVAAGLLGAAFFASLEYFQRFLLEDLAGYVPLRAHGEEFAARGGSHVFRPWLLALLPAAGALVAGLFIRLAPETEGGGGEAMIRAFHHQGGAIRRRVIWIKALASLFTLGSGGSGGREGPTMQIGGALGSFVGRTLKLGARERRLLMVAGVAAGMSAVFRTPLGAALLAIEILHRDDFEADALVPAILASVVAYSVVISIFGETKLLARPTGYAFVPAHLPLYALLALLVAVLATAFLRALRLVQRLSDRLPIPRWVRPAVGGLALGVLAVPVILFVGGRIGLPGQGFGIFGGGYGAAQMAMTGAPWLPAGWRGVELLLVLCAAKLVASSLTIGTGGSAGDFAPSLVLGGLLGGAVGRAGALLLQDPRIDPGAFALVGMGAFYGGIAHVPISSLILVSELAGSYDLLVPLMLAEGIAFVALRKQSLYEAQPANRRDAPSSPPPADDVLGSLLVGAVATEGPYVWFAPGTPARDVMRRIHDAPEQQMFPVLDPAGALQGIIKADTLRYLDEERDIEGWTLAADLMQAPLAVARHGDLRAAAHLMLAHDVHQVPVLADGRIVGFLNESDIVEAYLGATAKARGAGPPPPETGSPLGV